MLNISRRFETNKFGVRNENILTYYTFLKKVFRTLMFEFANMKNICQITFISVSVMQKSFIFFFAKHVYFFAKRLQSAFF